MKLRVSCPDPEATLAVGEAIGQAARPGLLVALQGPLGAGKTWLTKGIARGLEIAEWRYVTSPTFAIHNIYAGRLSLHHIDLYRVADAAELEGLGLEDCLYGADLCVLEWPDAFLGDLPNDRLLVCFRWCSSDARFIDITYSGTLGAAVWDELSVSLAGAVVLEESE